MSRSERAGELWKRVQMALDERRDPYADPRVVDELARQPELLAPLARLLQTLEALQRAPQCALAVRHRRLLARVAAAAALLVMAGAALAPALRRERPRRFTFEPSRGAVLSLQAEFVRLDGVAWRSTSVDVLAGRRGGQTTIALPDPPSHFPSVAALATQTFEYGVR